MVRRSFAALGGLVLAVGASLLPVGGQGTAATPLTGPLETIGSSVVETSNPTVPITLQGVHRDLLELGTQTYEPRNGSCGGTHVQCEPITTGQMDFAAGWGANIVRVPLSEDFWNQQCAAPRYPGLTGYDTNYRNEVAQVVSWITARHMVALLDLHTTQRVQCDQIPKTDINNTVAGKQLPYPVARLALPDRAGAVPFWQSVAAAFANQPLVAFELYNEPHVCSGQLSVSPGTPTGANGCAYTDGDHVVRTATLWRDGGSVTEQGVTYQAAGMKELYDAVRGAGANNLVFIDGNGWAGNSNVFNTINGSTTSYTMFATSNTVYAEHIYPCPDPADTACWSNPAKSSCATVSTILDNFEVGDVPNHPVVVDEFGWPNPMDGTETQNVVSHLHGPNGHGRGFVGFALSPVGYDPNSTGYKGSPFSLNMTTTLTGDDTDATPSGLPLKHAMQGIYPTTC